MLLKKKNRFVQVREAYVRLDGKVIIPHGYDVDAWTKRVTETLKADTALLCNQTEHFEFHLEIGWV